MPFGGPAAWEAAAEIGRLAALPEDQQPISTEIKMADGVFIKSMVIQKAGTYVPQHVHKYDHLSVIVRGAVWVWRDDLLGSAPSRAPTSILIKAGIKHLFQAAEDGTTILCVHDIGAAEGVEIAEEHQIVRGDVSRLGG